jgi:hypothetical protein
MVAENFMCRNIKNGRKSTYLRQKNKESVNRKLVDGKGNAYKLYSVSTSVFPM